MRILGLLVLLCLAGAAYIVGFDDVPAGEPALTGSNTVNAGHCDPSAIKAVENGASDSSTVSQGSIAVIFWCASAVPLPATPVTSVLVNGLPGYLFPAIAPSVISALVDGFPGYLQVRVQFPVQVSPGIATLQLNRNTQEVAQTKITLTPFAPGIFTLDGSGTGLVVAEHPDGKLITPFCPAAPGEAVTLYADGLGPTTPQVTTGELPGGFARTNTLPTMKLGGAAAQVSFADLSASLVGVYEVHVVVPGSAAAGLHPVQIQMGAESSNTAQLPVGKCGP